MCVTIPIIYTHQCPLYIEIVFSYQNSYMIFRKKNRLMPIQRRKKKHFFLSMKRFNKFPTKRAVYTSVIYSQRNSCFGVFFCCCCIYVCVGDGSNLTGKLATKENERLLSIVQLIVSVR